MPAPTPDQQKLTKLINKFRGISQYKSITQIPPDEAIDLLNVIVSNAGYLEKFRVPTVIGGPGIYGGNIPIANIDSMYMFTQGIGTRQIFINGQGQMGYFTDPENGSPLVFHALAGLTGDPDYLPRFQYVDSNNLLFGVNGVVSLKFDGTRLSRWGLPKPTTPPALGITCNITSIQRVGSVLTITFTPTVGVDVGFDSTCLANIAAGDVVSVNSVVGNATFNGNWPVTSTTGGLTITVTCNTAGNSGPFANDGRLTIYSISCSGTANHTGLLITSFHRTAGVSTVVFANNKAIGQFTGEIATVSGSPDTSFNGVWPIDPTLTTATSVSWEQGGPDVPVTAGGGAGHVIIGGFTNKVGPRTWRYSWAISATGEEGPASDISTYVPNSTSQGLVTGVAAILHLPPQPFAVDAHGFAFNVYFIDSYFLYASEDGGGTWNTVPGPGLNGVAECWPILLNTNGGGSFFLDPFDDTVLDAAFQANFINYPPPQNARFANKFQGRIFLAGMPDAPQDIVYSGFDQIYRGRPECSFPPFNRIKLAIGADKIAGFGVLMNGVVAWDIDNRMYLFSGTIQDITTTQPVQIADQLEEEPWQVGLASADSVQSTPRGVVWVGSDLNVSIWNGIFYGQIIGPRDLSVNIYPLMKRITPTMRTKIQSAFINWLERDWYVLNVALDGALAPTHLIFFDMSQEGADNLGIWISNIPCDSISVKVDSKGQRTLIASVAGVIKQLNTQSTATYGIHAHPTSTNSQLTAFWESGYWQDEPQMTKMYRYGRLTVDQDGFRLLATVLNDESSRLTSAAPWSKQLKLTPGGRFAINRKGRRVKFRIDFPRQDSDASVIELYTTAIPLAEN